MFQDILTFLTIAYCVGYMARQSYLLMKPSKTKEASCGGGCSSGCSLKSELKAYSQFRMVAKAK